MKLSDTLLDKFIVLYQKHFDIKLNRDEAKVEADNLIRFAAAALRRNVEQNER